MFKHEERTQPFGCVLSLGKGEEWKHERYGFAAEQMRSKYRACIVGSKYGYIRFASYIRYASYIHFVSYIRFASFRQLRCVIFFATQRVVEE